MVIAINSSELMVSWTSPECPYGVLDRYIVYYRKADTPQTTPNNSVNVNVRSTTLQYNIPGLPPYTNYTVNVQAVVLDRNGQDLLGVINEEQRVRTLSASGPPPTPGPTLEPTDPPTSREIVIHIGPPSDIDTGKVM